MGECTGRFPTFQVEDCLKSCLLKRGYTFINPKDDLLVEKADVSFALGEEPAAVASRAAKAIKLRQGHTVLRPRILPAYLKRLAKDIDKDKLSRTDLPQRVVASGEVFTADEGNPSHWQLEGMRVGALDRADWESSWQALAQELLGADTGLTFETAGDSVAVLVVDDPQGPVRIGYTAPVSPKALKAWAQSDGTPDCVQPDCAKPSIESQGWYFVIDLEALAFILLDISGQTDSIERLRANNVAILAAYPSQSPALSSMPDGSDACAIDILRELGYQETLGTVMYPDDIYKKMDMIQESWDKNNQGYPLVEKLGDLTALRTVLTPSIERTLGENYRAGVASARVFETGHIFLPQADDVLPKEKRAIAMGAYGDGIDIDAFVGEVRAFLSAFGIDRIRLMPVSMAKAYKWNECLLIMDENNDYLSANVGQISRKAQTNFGIGKAAYMANFELDALVKVAKRQSAGHAVGRAQSTQYA